MSGPGPHDADTAAGAFVEAGRVGRPHGLDGSFHVTRPLPDLLAAGRSVVVAGAPRTIVRRAGLDSGPIVRLEGIEGRDGAEALRGQPLLVTRDDLPELGSDEYWSHELEGCAVHRGERGAPAGARAGERLGTVARMIALPSCEALEVTLQDGGELLVPRVRDAIVAVDVGARRIDVDATFLGLDTQP